MQFALYIRDKAKAKSLIESGADVNKRTPYGTSPLHRAVSAGFDDIVKLLIDHGADVNAKDNWNWTSLHGVAFGHIAMVKLLIAKGANVHAKDDKSLTIIRMIRGGLVI